MFGGDGFDRIEGGNSDDVLYGEGGRDLLLGQMGNDSLFGSDGADGLFGGNGADLLFLGNGDQAVGGAGADDFVVGPWINAGSAPVINDFSTTDDVLVVGYQGPIAPDVEIRDGGLYLVGATDPLVMAAGLTDLSSVQLLQMAT